MTAIIGSRPTLGPAGTSSARIYDCLLGGQDHRPGDEDVADALKACVPNATALALAVRTYVRSAVMRAAAAGIRQFIDLGCGLPDRPDVHDIATAVRPDARTVYVDRDPAVLVHVRARQSGDQVGVVRADLTVPRTVTTNWTVRTMIDPGRPACLIAACALHWIPGSLEAAFDSYAKWLAPGSWMVITHSVGDWADPATLAGLSGLFAGHQPWRPWREVMNLFGGLEFREPPTLFDGGRRSGIMMAAATGVKPDLYVPRQAR